MGGGGGGAQYKTLVFWRADYFVRTKLSLWPMTAFASYLLIYLVNLFVCLLRSEIDPRQ